MAELTLTLSLRLYCRHVRMHVASISDYIMLDSISPRALVSMAGTLLTWVIYRPLYILTLSLVKLSILTFYRTLVPPFAVWRSLRFFRFTAHALIVFTILYTISTIAASIFQCTPISAAYSVLASLSQLLNHQNIPRPHCYNPTPLWVFSAVFNFATDVVILVLPVPVILSLQQMPRQKKISLLCMFSVGTIAIAASEVRMWILVLWSKDVKSRSKFGTDLLTWGQIEVNCGIVSASVTFLRPLVKRAREETSRRFNRTDEVLRRVEENDMATFDMRFEASETIIDGRLGMDEERKRVPTWVSQ
ncbi:hypothetical protein BDV96DRAFT_497053 [Lophiotrema nucula]|uniref:Rhodopsin domain-containing protein n=1 Tax=Lophiotrema nucula TaxID=690887 RepID=A0A6A5Z435_9PLEO|nr:hypothetical protein BDV96DRAFT_497053 [Lophiotrema nucula]